MSHAEPANASATLEIRSPNRFNWGALVVCCAYGVLLLIPLVVAMMAVGVLRLGALTIAIPVGTFAVIMFFLPFGFGNAYVARLAEPLRPESDSTGQPFLVQLTLTPRLRSGLRALVEDADDIGWLTCSNGALMFHGDSVDITIPAAQVKAVRRENGGLRGLFLFSRLSVDVTGLPQAATLKFAERSSLLLSTSRRLTTRLHQTLQSACPSPSR